jgi:tungstate transport system substrate-binding protein
MRLAVDEALMASGLARSLQQSFGRDTGVAVKLVAGPATAMLEALKQGELDAALSNAPHLEAALEKQGLVHDRRRIATAQFLLVGPAALATPLNAGSNIVLALQRLAQAQVPFLSAANGSGTHLLEQELWRAAATAPQGPWYAAAAATPALSAQAAARQACALVERGTWAQQGRSTGLTVLVDNDPRLAVGVHVMRSFRVSHPAAKLFVNWVAGRPGRRLIATRRGYVAAPAPQR